MALLHGRSPHRKRHTVHGEPVSTPEAESVVRLSFALRISNLGHGGRHSGERQAGRRTGFSVALWVFHPKTRHAQTEGTRGAIVNAQINCVTIDPVRSVVGKAAHPGRLCCGADAVHHAGGCEQLE